MVTTVTADTAVLKAKYEHLSDQLDLLMERLMSDERRWENIMMMQVNARHVFNVRTRLLTS